MTKKKKFYDIETRIVGGTESKPGAWPWAVIVGKPKDGGSFQVPML